jgi:hypothetical protein
MIRKAMLILLIFTFLSCNVRKNNSGTVDHVDNFEDYYIDNMVRIDKYDIDIDYIADNNGFVFKILTSDKYGSEKFQSDLVKNEYFKFTDLYWGRAQEYSKIYKEYWDKYFVKYRDEHLNENNDYSKVLRDFNKLRYEAVGYPDIKNVCIAYTKDDLEFIETNYINSEYLQEISSTYFEDNILVLVSFLYVGIEYLKNWEIINENNKYKFTVEIWKKILVTQKEYGIPLSGYRVIFLISIKK